MAAAFLGEMYRYRLAIRDQVDRVEVAMAALRSRREEIEQATEDLLVAPSMPASEFEALLQALYSEDIPEIWRLKSEAQFLLVAIRGVYIMCQAIADAIEGQAETAIRNALANFKGKIPDPTLLRNIHEHLEEYARGAGHQQHLLPDPSSSGAVAMTQEGLVYLVGGRLFELSQMVAEADKLAATVAEITRDLPSGASSYGSASPFPVDE
jgi:hypothetical protein